MHITNNDIYLINKYSVHGPRYTSYPTAPKWQEKFSDEKFSNYLDTFFEKKMNASLYVHFPYCPSKCFYCGCNSQLLSNEREIETFLTDILKEIEMIKEIIQKNSFSPFNSLHIGGGSPSFMSEKDFEVLIKNLCLIIDFSNLKEFSLEIDPRSVSREKLEFYSKMGVNRISFGVQDFNPKVQDAIGRKQSLKSFRDLFEKDISKKFKSVNFDLIYGLPFQTRKSFHETIEYVKNLNPSRIALYNYAHMPSLISHQNKIKFSDLPDTKEKTNIFIDSVNSLLEFNYEFIGMDHFAKRNDDLYLAQKNRKLHRNFMGYSASPSTYYLGLGPSAISFLDTVYSQNERGVKDYSLKLHSGKFPLLRGFRLSEDDILRKDVIENLICNFHLDFSNIENKYRISFQNYFKNDLKELKPFAKDNILILSDKEISFTPIGKLFVRNVCMVFDKYLKNSKPNQFSKTI